MFCPKCGNKMEEKDKFCTNCGAQNGMYDQGKKQQEIFSSSTGTNNYNNTRTHTNEFQSEDKCLAAFIIGLIGSIMGIFGGFCTTLCASAAYMVRPNGSIFAFIFIFGGSIVGMIGACQCLKNVKRGSILQLVGAVMIIICAYGITGADLMSILAFLLLLVGGIVGLVNYFVTKKK